MSMNMRPNELGMEGHAVIYTLCAGGQESCEFLSSRCVRGPKVTCISDRFRDQFVASEF